MTHLKCLAFPERARRLQRALAPEVRLGPLHFIDPMLLCGGLFLLFGMDAGGWLRLSLLASVLHEAGHVLACLIVLHTLPELDVTMTGFCLRTARLLLPPRQEAAIAAAGPAANFLAAAFVYGLMQQKATVFLLGFFWANLLVGAFNLLPVPPLDGAALLALLFGQKLHLRQK
ncbi:MAG: peptidase [Faecalibacterium sp.]|jgi:membrane-associated protease RseP (regulator of RpoE activity)|nr:peptidase [Faecalibacterium sp.]